MTLSDRFKSKTVDALLSFTFFQRITGKKWARRWRANYTLAERELSILPKLLAADSIAFDIGANRGEISYFLAHQANCIKIYSFEPQKRMFGVLCGVAESVPAIEPLNIALSDTDGEKTIHIPVKESGRYTQAASLEGGTKGPSADEKIQTTTLDAFVSRNAIEKLDFIKCDTEGHELSVFKGAQKTLASLRPILYIEVKDSTKGPLEVLLRASSYVPYSFNEKSGRLARSNGSESSENFYFIPKEKEVLIPTL